MKFFNYYFEFHSPTLRAKGLGVALGVTFNRVLGQTLCVYVFKIFDFKKSNYYFSLLPFNVNFNIKLKY